MFELSGDVDIPKRALFKAAEVCDLLRVQPYVLRSWEAEFPALGVAKPSGGPRIYRRTDVEQVARIRHLLLVEGLTLAGARRRLEEDGTLAAVDMPAIGELIGQNARERLTEVKRGLRSILELLASGNGGQHLRVVPSVAASRRRRVAVGRAKPPRGRAPGRRAAARRKRSA